MRSFLWLVAFLLGLSSLPCAVASGVHIDATTRNNTASSQPVTLYNSSFPPLTVRTKTGASAVTKNAADELACYLSQMAGQAFPREEVGSTPTEGIIVGTLQEFPDASLNAPLAIYNSIDGKEAYAIRSEGSVLKIIGTTDRGASHGVYRLLEELGCRWFFQSETWEIIPSNTNISFVRNITDRPAFLSRNISYNYAFSGQGHPGGNGRSDLGDFNDWARRNGMSGSFGVNTGHANYAMMSNPAFKAQMDLHPEYWALVGGTRAVNGQFEYGNPGLRQLIVDFAIQYFLDNPGADMVSIDPADGFGASQSPEALAYATENDAPFKMANQVALALRAAYPGQNKMVGLYAYNWHSDPPAFALEPEVYIQLTTAYNGGAYSLTQLLQLWPQKVKNLGFYDYYSIWAWDGDRWPGGRAGSKNYITNRIASFKAANEASGAVATSMQAEAANNWGLHGRTYYLADKLLWNPDLDSEAVLEDFYTKAFGSGSAHMKAYYAQQDNPPLPTKGRYKILFESVHAASQATLGDAPVQKRIDDIKTYLIFEYMNRRINLAEDPTERALWNNRLWKWAYRTRFTYMDYWGAMVQVGNGIAPTEPWNDNTPVTHVETETWFQEALAYYPAPDTIPTRRTFSQNLKRVNLGGTNVGYLSPLFQDQGGGTHIFMYSDGSPLQIRSNCYRIYSGNQRSWTVRNSAGTVVATGVPPSVSNNVNPPETWTTLTIPVAAPGVYEFTYNDLGGDLWRFEVDPSQTIAYPTTAQMGTTTLYRDSPELYLYVPLGATEFNYYFAETIFSHQPHFVIDPNGVKRKEVKSSDSQSYIKVMVPPGTDGKAWKIIKDPALYEGFGLGAFDFFDVPNVLSPSQARMLVPEDLVISDGLTLVPDTPVTPTPTPTPTPGDQYSPLPAPFSWVGGNLFKYGGTSGANLPMGSCTEAAPCEVSAADTTGYHILLTNAGSTSAVVSSTATWDGGSITGTETVVAADQWNPGSTQWSFNIGNSWGNVLSWSSKVVKITVTAGGASQSKYYQF